MRHGGLPAPASHLQRVEVRQPDAVPPAQVPPKVVVADVNGFQVPGFVPKEVQHIDGLQHRSGRVLTRDAQEGGRPPCKGGRLRSFENYLAFSFPQRPLGVRAPTPLGHREATCRTLTKTMELVTWP